MAVINRVINAIPEALNTAWAISWSNILVSDTATPFSNPGASDRSVQVTGTFGGGSIRITGSNDGVTYFPLTDLQGNELLFTSARLDSISELVRFIRPELTGGDGTTNLTVVLLASGGFTS